MITVPKTLPPLPYPSNALEPFINEETVVLHHDKIMAKYIDNLNKLSSICPGFYKMTLEELILKASRFPRSTATAIINNAGGAYNHIFYFDGMGPYRTPLTETPLINAIDNAFGSYDRFIAQFTKQAMAVFGSGWLWLCYRPGNCSLELMHTPNQLTPFGSGLIPVLCIDVWEHAYFLQYQNLRANYIDAFLHVVDWQKISLRYGAARTGKY